MHFPTRIKYYGIVLFDARPALKNVLARNQLIAFFLNPQNQRAPVDKSFDINLIYTFAVLGEMAGGVHVGPCMGAHEHHFRIIAMDIKF
jgi:hypothetical protein